MLIVVAGAYGRRHDAGMELPKDVQDSINRTVAREAASHVQDAGMTRREAIALAVEESRFPHLTDRAAVARVLGRILRRQEW